MNYEPHDYISNRRSNVVTVTGPLTQTEGEYHVHVRVLEA
jgi:hypothetical protein